MINLNRKLDKTQKRLHLFELFGLTRKLMNRMSHLLLSHISNVLS